MKLNLSPLEAMIVAINKKEVRERPSNEIKKDLEELIKNDYNKMRGRTIDVKRQRLH